ncbi:MAG: heme ABC transporter ATP-binding protein [Pseudaminobacter sp.]|nr:heme ABC transporter ATP-binding protein [Pseudaminobacter sp.]
MLEAENLDVSIGKARIVRDASFVAQAGEVTAIVGPNGSGKTTLLRAVSGDLSYTGTARINGRDCRTLSSWKMAEMRAVLPQATTLAFPFTVREIVGLGLTSGRSGASGSALVDLPRRALERVDLDGFAGRFYQELSGGEQQRVQLARVLCQVWEPVLEGQPRWLFLDEPVSSLDIKHQLIVMEIAAEFARRGGGVIAVLHDLNLAAMFANRIIVMNRGRVDTSGSPREVLADDLFSRVFDCQLKVNVQPSGELPFVLPQSARL